MDFICGMTFPEWFYTVYDTGKHRPRSRHDSIHQGEHQLKVSQGTAGDANNLSEPQCLSIGILESIVIALF